MILNSIIAGLVAFIVTVLTIPAFIRFYHKARIGGQQMLEPPPWVALFLS